MNAIRLVFAFSLIFFLGCQDHTGSENAEKNEDQSQGVSISFVEFTPLLFEDGNDLRNADDLYRDSTFVNGLSLVLSYYGVPNYRDSDSTGQSVWVDPAILEDSNIVLNFTEKAQDANWLRDHIGTICVR